MADPAASLPPPERTAHPFHTYDMIRQIPLAMRETFRRNEDRFSELAARLRSRERLVFTGCGTAFFAACLAESAHPLVDDSAPRTAAIQAFELLHYPRGLGPSTAVVAVSHSGITKTTIDALRAAKSRGASTIGVTHFDGRPIADVADEIVLAGDGPDRSRCHTKCYVASAVAGAALGLAWAEARGSKEDPTLHRDCGRPPGAARPRRPAPARPRSGLPAARGDPPQGPGLLLRGRRSQRGQRL